MTFEPLHITGCFNKTTNHGGLEILRSDPARNQKCNQFFSVCCAWFQKKPKPNKTVKLTLHHRPKPSSVDIQTLIHRNEPNRPHISSVFYQCQRATPKRPKQTDAPISQRARMPILKDAGVSPPRPAVSPACPPSLRSVRPSLRPVSSASAPPVKGVLSPTTNTRNPKIHKK